MDKLLEDLENCEAMLLSIKTSYEPMYRNLLIQWRNRKDEINKEIKRILSVRAACILLLGAYA